MRFVILPPDAKEISLGKQGENLAKTIYIPIENWIKKYGTGTFQLIHQRSGENMPYPVSIQSDEHYIYWNVTNTDTELAGIGKCELLYYVDEILAKSHTWATRVIPSLDSAGDVPEPSESWLNQVLRASADATDAAERAETAAIRQPIIQNGTWWTWDAEAEEYTDTGYPASGGGLPSGGTTGQMLTKLSGTDGDAGWRDLPAYDGVYEVTPQSGESVTMQTSQTYLDRDIVVKEVPYAEVINQSGGYTVTIGG